VPRLPRRVRTVWGNVGVGPIVTPHIGEGLTGACRLPIIKFCLFVAFIFGGFCAVRVMGMRYVPIISTVAIFDITPAGARSRPNCSRGRVIVDVSVTEVVCVGVGGGVGVVVGIRAAVGGGVGVVVGVGIRAAVGGGVGVGVVVGSAPFFCYVDLWFPRLSPSGWRSLACLRFQHTRSISDVCLGNNEVLCVGCRKPNAAR
jgi:hypothetical protein